MSQDLEPLTIDDLASIYRMETKSKSLSDIRKDFYPALTELSENARREYEDMLKKDPDSIFSDGMNERRKKILLHSRNIVDLRMEKIVRLALLGAMGGVNSINHLTPEERDYYTAVLESSKKHRSVTDNRIRTKATTLDEPDVVYIETKQEGIIDPAEIVKEKIIETSAENEEMITIRILEDLPIFSGPDRDYDLKKEDVIRMPSAMANALIVREKAVSIKVKP